MSVNASQEVDTFTSDLLSQAFFTQGKVHQSLWAELLDTYKRRIGELFDVPASDVGKLSVTCFFCSVDLDPVRLFCQLP